MAERNLAAEFEVEAEAFPEARGRFAFLAGHNEQVVEYRNALQQAGRRQVLFLAEIICHARGQEIDALGDLGEADTFDPLLIEQPGSGRKNRLAFLREASGLSD